MLAINTIVVPQGAEYQAVCRGLQQAKIDNLEIIAIPIGTKFVDLMLAGSRDRLDRSTGVLIVGLCGSLTTAHNVGESIVVSSCKNLQSDLVQLDSELTTRIQQKLEVKAVGGLTSDRIIVRAKDKSILAQQYDASIVEMEGYDYVTKLQRRKIPVAMLRVVSDDSQGDIPDLNRAIDPQGNLSTLFVAIALVKQPIPAIGLIKGSLAGLKALEKTTAKLFAN